MSPPASLLFALFALLPASLAHEIPISYARNCKGLDIGDVSVDPSIKTLDLPQMTLPYGSSGRVDIPDGCKAKGLGFIYGERIVACNTNKDGPHPVIAHSNVNPLATVWVNCAPDDGCYPGGAEVSITLYCGPGVL